MSTKGGVHSDIGKINTDVFIAYTKLLNGIKRLLVPDNSSLDQKHDPFAIRTNTNLLLLYKYMQTVKTNNVPVVQFIKKLEIN